MWLQLPWSTRPSFTFSSVVIQPSMDTQSCSSALPALQKVPKLALRQCQGGLHSTNEGLHGMQSAHPSAPPAFPEAGHTPKFAKHLTLTFCAVTTRLDGSAASPIKIVFLQGFRFVRWRGKYFLSSSFLQIICVQYHSYRNIYVLGNLWKQSSTNKRHVSSSALLCLFSIMIF